MFDLFQVNAVDGTVTFSIADNGANTVPAEKVIGFFEEYLNAQLTARQDAGIEKGPAMQVNSISSDGIASPSNQATSTGVDGLIINVE
jgi:hypothetical protein